MIAIRSKHKIIVLFSLFCIALSSPTTDLFSQNNRLKHVDEGDITREEVQRYIGYENLLLRYLTLPYDVAINVNERGNFVNMGYLLLMFLPLLFLALIWRHTLFRILTMFFMFLLVILSTSNSLILTKTGIKRNAIRNVDGDFVNDMVVTWADQPLAFLVKQIYTLNNYIYRPFNGISDSISGESDQITYPIVIGIFCFFGYIVYSYASRFKKGPLVVMGLIFFFYSFFWIATSSGILWYGYLMMFLGIMMLFLLLQKSKEESVLNLTWFKYTLFAFCGIWMMMNFVQRMTNINPGSHESRYGQEMINMVSFEYGTGKLKENQIVNKIYPGFDQVIKRINRDKNSLVYKVGTSMTYFVENNHRRVYSDNQLGVFNQLVMDYPDRETMNKVFKASGFKYIILDLNTPTLDKTQERTLIKKYNQFLQYIFENPEIEILSTNRIIEMTNPNTGKKDRMYGLFGDIIANGSYAIFALK